VPIKIDVRFIAATNLDLIQQVKKKAFRQDLYYRLSVIPLKILPLRERKGDIPLLIHYFMEYFNIKYGKNKVIEERAIQILMQQNFPGNVRQLKNLLERACLITTEDVLDAITLIRLYKEQEVIEISETDVDSQEKISMGTLPEMMEAYEKNLLEGYKKKYGSTYKIAEVLGTNQSTIHRKLQKYRII
jgi:TyrR family helix-turn-helix protein